MLGAPAFPQLPANGIGGWCRSGQDLDEVHHRQEMDQMIQGWCLEALAKEPMLHSVLTGEVLC